MEKDWGKDRITNVILGGSFNFLRLPDERPLRQHPPLPPSQAQPLHQLRLATYHQRHPELLQVVLGMRAKEKHEPTTCGFDLGVQNANITSIHTEVYVHYYIRTFG